MPYLMAGFPDQETSLAVAEAYAESGADLVELGVPFSDPLADGPTIHAAATAALEAGATLESALEVCEAVADRVPVVLMVYANMVLAHGGAVEFARRAARGRRRRGDRPRPAARGGGGGARGPAAMPAWRSSRLSRRRRRASAARRSARPPRASSTSSRRSGRRVSATSCPRSSPSWSPRPRPRPRCRSRSASASARPPRRPQVGRARRRRDHRQPPRPCRRRGRMAPRPPPRRSAAFLRETRVALAG